MAFNPNKNKEESSSHQKLTEIDKALQASKSNLESKQKKAHLILKQKNHELKKRYNFTLKPSNHSKLKQLCKEYGYSSASELIDDLIEEL